MRSCMLAIALLLVGYGNATGSSVIYESATFGGGGQGGIVLSEYQYVGTRFTIDSPVQVTAVGGDILEFQPGGLFGLLLSLSGPNALPSGTPFDDTTIAMVVFDAPLPSQDLSVPLTPIINPGTYGLVFGSGQFGATGSGAMNTGGLNAGPLALPGANSFVWNQQYVPGPFAWVGGTDPLPQTPFPRFVVYGDFVAVPEPVPVILVGSGLIVALLGKCMPRRKLVMATGRAPRPRTATSPAPALCA
jgi:hypothetical protein